MPAMPNVVGSLLQTAEGQLKASGVLVTASIGYFGTGAIRTQQGLVQGAAATWPITVNWVNNQTLTPTVDGSSAPTTPFLVLAQSPVPTTVVAVNSVVILTVIAPATSVCYPGTNLTN